VIKDKVLIDTSADLLYKKHKILQGV